MAAAAVTDPASVGTAVLAPDAPQSSSPNHRAPVRGSCCGHCSPGSSVLGSRVFGAVGGAPVPNGRWDETQGSVTSGVTSTSKVGGATGLGAFGKLSSCLQRAQSVSCICAWKGGVRSVPSVRGLWELLEGHDLFNTGEYPDLYS